MIEDSSYNMKRYRLFHLPVKWMDMNFDIIIYQKNEYFWGYEGFLWIFFFGGGGGVGEGVATKLDQIFDGHWK